MTVGIGGAVTAGHPMALVRASGEERGPRSDRRRAHRRHRGRSPDRGWMRANRVRLHTSASRRWPACAPSSARRSRRATSRSATSTRRTAFSRFARRRRGCRSCPGAAVSGPPSRSSTPRWSSSTTRSSGEPLLAVPALHLDVALVYAETADEYGNAQVVGTGHMDGLLGSAADRVILQTDRVVSNDVIRQRPERTWYWRDTRVVRAPFGTHPYSSGSMVADVDHLRGLRQRRQGRRRGVRRLPAAPRPRRGPRRLPGGRRHPADRLPADLTMRPPSTNELFAVLLARDLRPEDLTVQVGANLPMARAAVTMASLTTHPDTRVVLGIGVESLAGGRRPPPVLPLPLRPTLDRGRGADVPVHGVRRHEPAGRVLRRRPPGRPPGQPQPVRRPRRRGRMEAPRPGLDRAGDDEHLLPRLLPHHAAPRPTDVRGAGGGDLRAGRPRRARAPALPRRRPATTAVAAWRLRLRRRGRACGSGACTRA